MDDPSTVANLYATLALSSAASAAEIKSSYRRLALIHHPDKLPPASSLAVIAEANTKFQTISFAYSILHDQVRRAHYDKTGRTEEGEGLAARSEQEWRDYFKTLWKGEVNADTIEEFTLNYQGSEEEKEDLFAAYVESSGSLDLLLTKIMCSTIEDEDRFITLINHELASSTNSLPEFKIWKKVTKDAKAKSVRRAKASREAVEAEGYAAELGVSDKLFGARKGKGSCKGTQQGGVDDAEAGLRALIQGRQNARLGSLIGSIEARYAAEESEKKERKRSKGNGAEPNKRQKAEPTEPTDEEFAKARADVEARRSASGKGGRKGK